MTCPICAALLARALDLHAQAGHITPQLRALTLAAIDTTKEHDMHITKAKFGGPIAGDIGEEQEEWEVFPEHVPAETPVESPAPAPIPA